MSCFSAVEADLRSAGRRIVSLHVAVTACLFLSVVLKDYLEFSKAQVARNRAVNPDSVMMDPVKHSGWLVEFASSAVDDLAVRLKACNNGCVR